MLALPMWPCLIWPLLSSQGGQFLLRIEDTDQARSTPESEQAILDALHWLGLDWDEGPDNGGPKGPYRQSERSEIYRKHADQLLDSGHAFRCFCTAERLDELRVNPDGKQTAAGLRRPLHAPGSRSRSLSAQPRVNPMWCACECPEKASAALTICCAERSASTGPRLICRYCLKPTACPPTIWPMWWMTT